MYLDKLTVSYSYYKISFDFETGPLIDIRQIENVMSIRERIIKIKSNLIQIVLIFFQNHSFQKILEIIGADF